jgi:accessory gene regulator B
LVKILTNILTNFVNKNDEQADIEVVQYGIELFVQEVTMFIFIIITSLFLDLFFVVFVTILGYSLVRAFANGVHAQNRIVCSLSYITFIYGTIGISFLIGNMNLLIKIILLILNILILFKYSPGDTDDRPIISKKIKTRNKYLSIVSVVFIFIISFAINPYSYIYSNVLIIISTLVSLLTLPIVYRVYGCKKSNETEVKI